MVPIRNRSVKPRSEIQRLPKTTCFMYSKLGGQKMSSKQGGADNATDGSPEMSTAAEQGSALTLSVLNPTQLTSPEKWSRSPGSKGDRYLSFCRAGGSSSDRVSRWVFWKTLASSLLQAGATHFRSQAPCAWIRTGVWKKILRKIHVKKRVVSHS